MHVFLSVNFGYPCEISLYHLHYRTREECVIITCRFLKPFKVVLSCMHAMTTLSVMLHVVLSTLNTERTTLLDGDKCDARFLSKDNKPVIVCFVFLPERTSRMCNRVT